jgi:hypothetical protein
MNMSKIKLSKRQKACLGVLVIGLGFLVVDRLYVLPKSAPAEEVDYSVHSVPSSGRTTSGTPGNPATDPNDRLANLEVIWSDRNLDLGQTRDAFSVLPSWRDGHNQDIGTTLKSDPVSRFVMRHRLKAVAISMDRTAAFIDDRFMSVGQELDGFKLVAVDQESATFELGGKRITLKLTNDR